jgi:hypothetical protein
MAMKLVWAILYLAAVSATMLLANKVVGSSMKRIRAGRQRTWLGLAAWVISLLSSAIPLLVKKYETEILNLIGRLV